MPYAGEEWYRNNGGWYADNMSPQDFQQQWLDAVAQYERGEMRDPPIPPVRNEFLPPGFSAMSPAQLRQIPVADIISGSAQPNWWVGTGLDNGGFNGAGIGGGTPTGTPTNPTTPTGGTGGTTAPPNTGSTGGLLGPGNRPPPMAEPVDPITGGPRVPLPNEPVLPPGSVFMPPPNAPTNPSPGAGPDRGSLPGNPLASFGFTRGPAGEILPLMLQQGASPFQNQQPQTFSRAPQYTHPTQLQRALFNPDIQGYQWFQPPTEGATANPNQPPATGSPGGGGGYTGPPNYNGGFDPNTGSYFDLMKSQGLLGAPVQTPAALRGLLS